MWCEIACCMGLLSGTHGKKKPPKPVGRTGTVTAYDASKGAGLISGGRGDDFKFALVDWRENWLPLRGDAVKFIAVDNNAKDIFAASQPNDMGQRADRAGRAFSPPPDVTQAKPQPEVKKPDHMKQEKKHEEPEFKFGQVVEWRSVRKKGYISGGRGDDYRFGLRDWRGQQDPERGQKVSFFRIGDRAKDVAPETPTEDVDDQTSEEPQEHQPTDRTGLVVDYNRLFKRGSISGGRGDDYRFRWRDWRGDADPERGDEVKFVAIGDNAKDVFPIRPRLQTEAEDRGGRPNADDMTETHQRDSGDNRSDAPKDSPNLGANLTETEHSIEARPSGAAEKDAGDKPFDPEVRIPTDHRSKAEEVSGKKGGFFGRFSRRG